jgi:hypothetical protein
MRKQELILFLPKGNFELYLHILNLYLDTVILSFDQRW